MIYTLDTNVLIDAIRQPAELERLKAFLSWALPQTVLSSVVAVELLAGARTTAARRLVEAELLAAFERRGRIVAPTAGAWLQAGSLLGRLKREGPGESWQNDVLLACSARERGWVVVTRDADVVRLRAEVRGLRVEAPFPKRPST